MATKADAPGVFLTDSKQAIQKFPTDNGIGSVSDRQNGSHTIRNTQNERPLLTDHFD